MHVLYVYAFMQIIFESLPVSSSGNVLLWIPLLQNILNLQACGNDIPDFDFLLHVPTIFIIGVFFFRPLYHSIINIQKGFGVVRNVIICCALADAVTVLFYFLWKAVGTAFFPLWVGFFCTTLLLFSLRLGNQTSKNKRLCLADAFILGMVQGCALLPGISRLAATFVAGVWLGYAPEQSFRYSFLIQIPLLGAALLQAVWSVVHLQTYGVLAQPEFYGTVCLATLLSFCLLSGVSVMVKQKTVWLFAWYTAFLSALALLFG